MRLLTSELITSLALIALVVAVVNPMDFLMPMSVGTWLAISLTLVFLVFSGLVWKEYALDEREDRHRLRAGRLSFLVGLGILVVGIIIQSFNHTIDPWLVYALAGMVLSKALSRIYSEFKE